MGLFDKKIGPVFLKENSSADEYIDKLNKLGADANGELKTEIEKQIAIAKVGILGEKNIAFELKNSGMDMYILHDIYLEYNDLSAQIDYLIVTRKRTYVIECKNLIGDIEINNNGDFIRTYELFGKKIKEGIYSPITQNARHLNVIKELKRASKTNFVTKMIFENYFDDNYKSIVVLANPKTLLNAKYAKKEVKEKIVRADQLINKIREMDSQVKDGNLSEKDMLNLANFYLSMNNPNRSDYARKYEEILDRMKDKINEEKTNKEKQENILENEGDTKNDCKKELVVKLKAYRLNQSRLDNIKPYFIFNDAQMEDLINKKPKSKEELLSVSGFGSVKVEKYGDAILQILNE